MDRYAVGATGRSPVVAASDVRATDRSPARDDTGARPNFGAVFALTIVVLVNAVFVVNNLAPYLGLHYAGAMTMFSNQAAINGRHFFMPKLALSDAGVYVQIQRFEPRNVESPAASELGAFATWTGSTRRVVNLNFVRYHVSRVCESAPDARVGLTLRTEAGAQMDFENVCAEPSMLRYSPLTSMSECKPVCWGYVKQWARS